MREICMSGSMRGMWKRGYGTVTWAPPDERGGQQTNQTYYYRATFLLYLRPHTFATLFGLYVAAGLRANEPLRLDRDDVDLVNGVLTIRDTKFGKTRYVPVHPTTQRALQRYAARRDRWCHDPETPSFFVSDRGTRLTDWCVRWTFVKLSHEIGLRGAGDSRGPRLHDLRHRLAINTLLRWYQRGVDVERHLPQLSTYLGHAHITDTYWYFTATPKLLHYALQRVERAKQGQRP